MSKNSEQNPAQKKRTRDVIEETFARYEPKEETPPLPKIEEPPSRVVSGEKVHEPLMTQPQPEASPKIVSTGIPGIDAALGGGIPSHSLILICGEVGSNHDVFTHQILYNHTQENGKTAYYLAETLSVDIQEQMEKFNWTIKDALNSENWKFIDMHTPDLQQLANLYPKRLTDKTTIKLTPQLNTLKTDLLTKTKEGYWTAIELGHLLSTYDTKELINLMLYWRATTRTHGGLHFALLPTGVHPETQINALKNIADGVIEFSLKQGPHEFENNLTIKKMKNLLKPLILTFTTDENGINIDTAARIT
ncbi:MAG: hypothetical protein N3D85_05020 [Candidatus Bathyarchaeota archaeon]|nr:hypothetical protein [Candidatus Bathyarchaeota archaeon]